MADDTADAKPAFDWYRSVSGAEPLEQGDFFDNFPILIPTAGIVDPAGQNIGDTLEISADVGTANVVLMTQSCDMQKLTDNDPLIFCPRFNLKDAKVGVKSLNTSQGWGDLQTGRYVSLYLVNKCDLSGHKFDYQVVYLAHVYSAPLSLVKNILARQNKRLRLLPPYREHLAQAFARQFMRIGLPVDLPKKYPYGN